VNPTTWPNASSSTIVQNHKAAKISGKEFA